MKCNFNWKTSTHLFLEATKKKLLWKLIVSIGNKKIISFSIIFAVQYWSTMLQLNSEVVTHLETIVSFEAAVQNHF